MKALKLILIGIGVLLAGFLLVCLILLAWNGFVLPKADEHSTAEFDLPGYEDKKFDMQAIACDEETKTFFFSGYMLDKTTNPLYLRSGDGNVRRVNLLMPDGTDLYVHAGGIQVCGDYVYLAGGIEDCLYVFSRDELLSAKDGDSVRSLGTFATASSAADGVRASFLSSDGEKLYVGEFYLFIPLFWLRLSHRIGSTRALMAAFTIDPDKPYGLDETPCEAYCLPDMVQGCEFYDDKIILSRSIFLVPSEIASYTKTRLGKMMLMDTEVPVYTLHKTGSVWMPPASEEIELADGKLYIATEVCSWFPSWFYQLWDGQKIRAVPIENLK